MKRFILVLILLAFSWPLLSEAESVPWLSYQEGIAKAKSDHKKIFLNFFADW